jgi:hypothetical protein
MLFLTIKTGTLLSAKNCRQNDYFVAKNDYFVAKIVKILYYINNNNLYGPGP